MKDCEHRTETNRCRLAASLLGDPVEITAPIPPDFCDYCQKKRDRADAADPGPVVAGIVSNLAKKRGLDALVEKMKPFAPKERPKDFEGADKRPGCAHLGETLDKTRADGTRVNCDGCYIHACEIYGRCSTGRNDRGVRSCVGCADWKLEAATPLRKEGKPPAAEVKAALAAEGWPAKKATAAAPPPEWAVVMTAAPRRESTVSRCLASAIAAGFRPVVLAEPGTELGVGGVEVVQWPRPTGGSFPNFWLALQYLAMMEPSAKRFLYLQDDALFPPGDWSGRLAAAPFWGDRDFGIFSLFTSARYAAHGTGGEFAPFRPELDKRRAWLYSAQAMAWNADSFYSFLESRRAVRHRRFDSSKGLRRVDALVGNWAKDEGRKIWLRFPSIVQHVGDTSTLWRENLRANGWRAASEWEGDRLPSRVWRASGVVSICVALRGRASQWRDLVADLERQTDRGFELVVADYLPDRTAAASAERDRAPFPVRIVPLEGPFNRSAALNAAAAHAAGDRLFFLDVDMAPPATFVADVRRRVEAGRAWFPICYSLNRDRPAMVLGDRKGDQVANGWWRRTGFGNVGIRAEDFARVGPWNVERGRTWGLEDSDFRDAVEAARLKIDRAPYQGFFHRWHAEAERHVHHDAAAPLPIIAGARA